MLGINSGIIFILVLGFVVTLFTYIILKDLGKPCVQSKAILNQFEIDNTAPEITKLIKYHKNNQKIHYKI